MKPRACGSFCLLRSEAALKGYAAHLEEAHAAHAELFLFSEQDGLDVDRLHRLEGDEAWVLLLLTGSSSYLWFDQEHHPRNLELCSVLRQRFQRINFVICPTSNSARDTWLASNTSLQSILGSAFQGNESLWDRFDPGFVSNRGICRLIQERQQEETQRPPETRLGTSRWLSVFFTAGLIAGCAYGAYLWNDRNRLRGEVVRLREDLDAVRAGMEEYQIACRRSLRAERQDHQERLAASEANWQTCENSLDAHKLRVHELQKRLDEKQAEGRRCEGGFNPEDQRQLAELLDIFKQEAGALNESSSYRQR